MNPTTTLFLFLFLLWQVSLPAQPRQFHKLTVEDGLSQNAVLCFAQDKAGFLWIGTSSGLNRYDSRSFQVFKQKAGDDGSLTGNNISSLLVGSNDRVWVGTTNGLNIYDRITGRFRHYQRQPDLRNGLGNNVIRSLYEDQQQRLWVGTAKGLYLFKDGEQKPFEEIVWMQGGRNILAADIRAIRQDIRGDLWVGVGDQVIRITHAFSSRVMKSFPVRSSGHNQEERTCTSLEEDEFHTLWMGTMGSGLFRFNEKEERFDEVANATRPEARLPHDYIRKLRADRKGRLWIGTQQGLCEMELRQGKIITHQYDPGERYSLSQNSIYDIFIDKTDNLWAGTYYGGISLAYARNTPFILEQATGKADGLASNVVSSVFFEPGKGLWIGTDAGGISFRDATTGNWKQYRYDVLNPRSLGSNLVKCIFRDRDGRIWVGTHGGGLNLLNEDRNSFTRFKRMDGQAATLSSNDVMSIAEDARGKLWLATENNGLNCFDKRNRTFATYHPDSAGKYQLNAKFLRTILIDRMDGIWVASEGGLFYRKKEEDSFREYDHIFKDGKRLPSGEPVRTLCEDSRKQLWVGTASQGIVVIRPGDDHLITYSMKDGLPSNNIKGMTEDHSGNMWITTDNGLCTFVRQSNRFIAFNVHDGLPGNDFNNNSFFRDQDGRIFVGGLNGMIHFEPQRIEKNSAAHAIHFTTLRIGNEVIDPTSRPDVLDNEISSENEIHLRHKDNVFTIDFRLLSFIKPQKNQYLYRLKGFEPAWTANNTGSVTYTNLPSGTYELQVRAANNDGLWNPEPVRLKVVVHPPLWATWWAYLFYLMALAYIVFIVIRYFWIREKFRHEQLLQQYKIDFFTNISHEIRTQLTLIATPLQAMASDELPETMRKSQVESMRKHTQRLSELVSELLDFRKAETGNMKLRTTPLLFWQMIEEITEDFEAIAREKGIELVKQAKEQDLTVRIDRQQMSKVISNLISNALKFTDRGGKVGIEFKQKGEQAVLRVWDTGIGIDPKYFRNLFSNFFQVNDERSQNTGYGIGLALARSIVELHGGSIDVSSKVRRIGHGGFTVFTVRLPLVKPETASAAGLANTSPLQENGIREKPLVLVAEDHEDLRRFVADALSNEFEILEARNGVEGLHAAHEFIPDLIISDIMMPIMDGLTFCGEVKKNTDTCHIPVILLTAKATLEDQITGLENKADAYLTKPFDLRLLKTQVNNLLQSRSALQDAYRRHYLTPSVTENKSISIDPDPFLQRLVEVIAEHMDDIDFTVAELARCMTVSQPVLYKKVKALTDLSVNDFIKSLRMKKAAELLKEEKYTVAEVAYMVGFADRKYFSKEFRKYYGHTPSAFANKPE